MHFPDGHPTLANPYPTLLLGYATASSATKTRKPPRERLPTPLHSQTNETQATEQSAPEQDAPVVEDDILLVNEQSHTAINDHWYSQTSSGCLTSRLMWMANMGPFKCYVTLFFWKLDPTHPLVTLITLNITPS